jgi:hypothetical protein
MGSGRSRPAISTQSRAPKIVGSCPSPPGRPRSAGASASQQRRATLPPGGRRTSPPGRHPASLAGAITIRQRGGHKMARMPGGAAHPAYIRSEAAGIIGAVRRPGAVFLGYLDPRAPLLAVHNAPKKFRGLVAVVKWCRGHPNTVRTSSAWGAWRSTATAWGRRCGARPRRREYRQRVAPRLPPESPAITQGAQLPCTRPQRPRRRRPSPAEGVLSAGVKNLSARCRAGREANGRSGGERFCPG